jgi:hypothetical protein
MEIHARHGRHGGYPLGNRFFRVIDRVMRSLRYPFQAVVLLASLLHWTGAAAAEGDENWAGQFGVPGADSTVETIAVFGEELYAGGWFQTIGGTAAPYIARWDGAKWSSLGAGVDGPVLDLLVSGSALFVAGAFSNAGGMPSRGLAKWDGANWSTMGSVNGWLHALASDGASLYVGGQFTAVDGSRALRIARLNPAALRRT